MEYPVNDKQLIRDCEIGEGTKIWNFVNMYCCKVGRDSMVGTFVEIQEGVEIGRWRLGEYLHRRHQRRRHAADRGESMRRRARSVEGSTPTTVALNSRLSCRVTSIVSPPSMTW